MLACWRFEAGVVVVGLELGELQVDALEVGSGDVAGVETRLAEVDGLAVVGEVLLGDCERRLGEQHIGEGLADGEDELALLIAVLALA